MVLQPTRSFPLTTPTRSQEEATLLTSSLSQNALLLLATQMSPTHFFSIFPLCRYRTRLECTALLFHAGLHFALCGDPWLAHKTAVLFPVRSDPQPLGGSAPFYRTPDYRSLVVLWLTHVSTPLCPKLCGLILFTCPRFAWQASACSLTCTFTHTTHKYVAIHLCNTGYMYIMLKANLPVKCILEVQWILDLGTQFIHEGWL